jgi:hypothetical protein
LSENRLGFVMPQGQVLIGASDAGGLGLVLDAM